MPHEGFLAEMMHPVEPQPGEISLADLVQKIRSGNARLWRERFTLARTIAGGCTLGLAFALTASTEYTASTRLLPYRGSAANAGLSGLAGLAGIRLPAGVGDQTITADLYPVIAGTLDFRIDLAETPLRFTEISSPITLVSYFQAHRTLYERAKSVFAEFLSKVKAATVGTKERETGIALGSNGRPLRTYGREYLRIVRLLDKRLEVRFDKKTSVITLTGTMPDPYAAADLVQAASERLMRRIIEYEAKKAGEQLILIERQYSQNKNRYESAQRDLALYADRNRMLVSAVSQIERERLQREYDVAFQVFQQLRLELEQAKIKKSQDTPVFTVLEQVAVPNERASPQRSLIVTLSALIGLVVGLVLINLRQLTP